MAGNFSYLLCCIIMMRHIRNKWKANVRKQVVMKNAQKPTGGQSSIKVCTWKTNIMLSWAKYTHHAAQVNLDCMVCNCLYASDYATWWTLDGQNTISLEIVDKRTLALIHRASVWDVMLSKPAWSAYVLKSRVHFLTVNCLYLEHIWAQSLTCSQCQLQYTELWCVIVQLSLGQFKNF